MVDLSLANFKVVSDLGGLAKHDRGRAVLLRRQVYGALDLLAFEVLPGHDEMEVDFREHFRILLRPLGGDFHHAAGDRRPAFPEDVHDIVGRAAAGADQHRLHGPRPQVAAAALGCAVHHLRMPALGLADEGDVLQPLDADFHTLEVDGDAQMVPGKAKGFVKEDAAIRQAGRTRQEVDNGGLEAGGVFGRSGNDFETRALECELRGTPGVVGTGLFLGMADLVLLREGERIDVRRRA